MTVRPVEHARAHWPDKVVKRQFARFRSEIAKTDPDVPKFEDSRSADGERVVRRASLS